MPLLANYHTHTIFCDGKNTAQEMADQAFRLGFKHLGFSGHMDPDNSMDWPVYCAEIRRLQKQYEGRMEILCGTELDNLYDPETIPGADYVIGSTHYVDVDWERPLSVDHTPQQIRFLAEEFFGGDYYRLAKAYYALETQIYDRTGCTFVGHFDLVVRFNDDLHFLDESDPRYTGPALEAMEYLVKEGVPFEINCGAFNRGRKKELYPNRFLLKKLKEFGGEILINSDAHQRELLNGGFDTAVRTALECGFTHTNLLVRGKDGKVKLQPLALDICR